SVGVPPTRSASIRLSKPRVPIQEPTGKFALPAPPTTPRRRSPRKSGRVRKLFAWLWRNAEPLAWATTLSALAFSLWFSPRTQLTRLVVQGVPAEAQASVEQAIRTHLRAPIALSDAPRRIEHALNALDWTRHTRWRAAGIGTAHLLITPRTPAVLIEGANGARIFADPTGFLFVPPNRDAKPLSGQIRLGQGYPLPQRGCMLNGEMRRAFTILQRLTERTDVRSLLGQVSKTQGIRVECNFQRGSEPPFSLQVRFGDARALNTQLERLSLILEMPLEQLRQCEYIDISAPGAEVIKPRLATAEDVP
ncbi:MAG: cell division protein FtsQ/DivIB, partial [Fimbriimonadales bacterium]